MSEGIKTLAELQAESLPRLEFVDLFKGVTCEDDEIQIGEYLAAFLVPDKGLHCPACGAALSGFRGTFQWRIVHGEGFCSTEGCGYPIRMYHRIKDRTGTELLSLTFPLAYHPDYLTRGEPPAHPSTAETEQEDGSATGRPDREGSGR